MLLYRTGLLLMVLFLSSCIRDRDCCPTEPEVYKNTITVKIQLPDNSSRASVEPPLTGVGVIVKQLDVYFYNIASGEIFTKVSLSSSEIVDISTHPGLTFSDLDVNVNGVAVVANNSDIKGISKAQGENIYDLFSKELNIVHEQVLSSITLYGKSERFTNILPKDSKPYTNYYTTDITIKPLVARMEISETQCMKMDEDGKIQNLNLHSIFLDNTYEYITVGKEKPIVSSPFLADETTVLSHPQDWWIYSYTSVFPSIPNNDPAQHFSPDVNDPTISGDGVFAFHFIPSDLTPWVRLRLVSTFDDKSWYFNIKGFVRNGTRVIFETGYIYKVKLVFLEENLTEFDDDLKTITVEVDIQNWTIMNGILPE